MDADCCSVVVILKGYKIDSQIAKYLSNWGCFMVMYIKAEELSNTKTMF